MTTNEAIQLFIQVEQQFVCDGKGHDALKEAIRVLREETKTELAPVAEE